MAIPSFFASSHFIPSSLKLDLVLSSHRGSESEAIAHFCNHMFIRKPSSDDRLPFERTLCIGRSKSFYWFHPAPLSHAVALFYRGSESDRCV